MAGKRIADLFVSLRARTTGMQKGFSDAARQVGEFGAKLGAVSAAIGVAAGAGVSTMIMKSSDAVDRVAKLGRTIGITAAQMATFELAAGRGGVSMEQFARGARQIADIAQDALRSEPGKMNRSAETFQELGISLAQIKPIANDTQALLYLVADALKRMPDGAKKATLQMELFGARAAEMINAMSDGSKALKTAEKNAREFGLTLHQGTATKVEEFKDSFSDFGNIMAGFGRQVAADLSPVLLTITESLKTMFLEFAKGRGGVQGLAGDFAGALVTAMETVAHAAARVYNAVMTVVNAFKVLKTFATFGSAAEIKKTVGDFLSGAGQIDRRKITSFADEARDQVDLFKRLNQEKAKIIRPGETFKRPEDASGFLARDGETLADFNKGVEDKQSQTNDLLERILDKVSFGLL